MLNLLIKILAKEDGPLLTAKVPVEFQARGLGGP